MTRLPHFVLRIASWELEPRFWRCAFSLLLFLALGSVPFASTYAQSATATLSGTIEDERGALVPGVAVSVVNVATALRRQATTNDSGYFTIPLLPPGTYTVRAEAQGFMTAETRDIVLNVGDTKALRIPLKTGDIKETVVVEGGAPLVNSESPAVGNVIDRQFVENMPLNGRSIQSLIFLTPGVVSAPVNTSGNGQFSVNGQRATANYVTVDGVSANIAPDRGAGSAQGGVGSLPGFNIAGTSNGLVSVDALQEFRIQTSTYAPEFGRTPGGQISLITRSGTNSFNATIFDYIRNNIFDANDWFANKAGVHAPLRQNQFGATVAGPILLPRFGEGGKQPGYNGRNRTFFFFSYEGQRLLLPTGGTFSVPSLCVRGLGSCPAGDSAAPAALLPFLNAYSLPNGPQTAPGRATLTTAYSNPTNVNATSIRVDHQLTRKQLIYFRYNVSPSELSARQSNNPANIQSQQINFRTFTVSATSNLSTRLLNEFRFNYSHSAYRLDYTLDDFGGAVPLAPSLLSGIFPSGFSPQGNLFSLFSPLTVRLGSQIGNQQRQLNLVDNISYAAGNHQLKFGFDFRQMRPVYAATPLAVSFLFSNNTSLLASTVSSLGVSSNATILPIFNNYSVYGQDTWRVTTRLTMTYGVRWEIDPPGHEASGRQPLLVTGLDNPATATIAPAGTQPYKTRYGLFAPRLGLAYQLSQRSGRETVLRGGVGQYYDLGSNLSAAPFQVFPFVLSTSTSNVHFPFASPVSLPVANANPPYPANLYSYDPGFAMPYTLSWNFAVEQGLGKSQAISATYDANFAHHQLTQITTLKPNTSFSGNVRSISTRGSSNYQSMKIQYQRRLTGGLQATAFYTWSHAIDTVSNELTSTLSKADSTFDIRHTVSGAASYYLPHATQNSVLRAVTSGWSLDGIFRVTSAPPTDVTTNVVAVGTDQFVNRPNLTPGIPIILNNPLAPGGKEFNVATDPTRPGCRGAFCPPATGQVGNVPRNAFRLFGFWQVDASLKRRFMIHESIAFSLRTDVFNVFNHPNFSSAGMSPIGGIGQALLMYSGTTGVNSLFASGGPRSVQFSLKLEFGHK